MGFFSKPEPTRQGLPPLTQERMKALFDQEKWSYFVDNEGDLGGIWDGNQFFFLQRGDDNEILHVTARWHHTLPIEHLDAIRNFLNEWNKQKLWPKVFHRIGDEGRISLIAEHAADWEHGVTDEQLALTVHCALSTSLHFFEAVETEFSK